MRLRFWVSRTVPCGFRGFRGEIIHTTNAVACVFDPVGGGVGVCDRRVVLLHFGGGKYTFDAAHRALAAQVNVWC